MEPVKTLPIKVADSLAKAAIWSLAGVLAATSIAQAPTPTAAVAAGNPEGESSEVSAEPGGSQGGAGDRPNYPRGAEDTLQAKRLNVNLVELTWTGNLQPGSKYKVFRFPGRTSSRGWEMILVGGTVDKRWVDRNAPGGLRYRYAVVAAWDDPAVYNEHGAEFSEAVFCELHDTYGTLRAAMPTPPPGRNPPPLNGGATIGKFVPKVWNQEQSPDDPITITLPASVTSDPPPENSDSRVFDGVAVPAGDDPIYGKKDGWLPRGVGITLSANLTGIDGASPTLDVLGFGPITPLPGAYVLVTDTGSHQEYNMHMAGTFTLISGKFTALQSSKSYLSPPTWTPGFDASSAPQWLMVPTGSRGTSVTLSTRPMSLDRTVNISLTSPNCTPSPKSVAGNGRRSISVKARQSSGTGTLDASINEWNIASVNTLALDPRGPIRVAVCKVTLIDDQGQRVFDDNGKPISGNPPDAGKLQKYLNKVYQPQVNVTFECTALNVPLNYDVGTESENVMSPQKRGHHDHRFNWPTVVEPFNESCGDDRAEMGVFSDYAETLTKGQNPYKFILFYIDQWTNRPWKKADAQPEVSLVGQVERIGGNFAFIQNLDNGTVATPAHEIGHLFGLRHPWATEPAAKNYEAHLRAVPDDTVRARLMSYEQGEKLIKPEWDLIINRIDIPLPY
jgi:hypothetical protein